tara:strand:- start:241 stop:744 length:504 start_codon:yes stop_codon:yes gene_type:complete
MKSKGNLVFLGMMGSGKTSIGKLVSKKLKLKFLDIDQLIEENLKMDISKIFSKKGEKFFRDLEEKTTLEALKKKNIVIALGGGAFLNNNIRREILKSHISIWLYCNHDILIKRIKNSSKRPLAFNLKKNELLELIKKRSDIYSKALYRIECSELSKNKVVKKILNLI